MKKFLLSLLFISMLCTPAFAGRSSLQVLLNAVVATGASTDIEVDKWRDKTFYIVASSVTSGGTVLIQTSSDGTDWATISTNVITADGTTEVAVTGLYHRFIRANLSARTDGTYTVTIIVNQ